MWLIGTGEGAFPHGSRPRTTGQRRLWAIFSRSCRGFAALGTFNRTDRNKRDVCAARAYRMT